MDGEARDTDIATTLSRLGVEHGTVVVRRSLASPIVEYAERYDYTRQRKSPNRCWMILILLIGSGFSSSSEIALFSLPTHQVDAMVEEWQAVRDAVSEASDGDVDASVNVPRGHPDLQDVA